MVLPAQETVRRVGAKLRGTIEGVRLPRVAFLLALALALQSSPAGATTTVISPRNLTANPAFESGTAGWGSHNSSVSSIPASDGPVGDHVAYVARTSGSWYSLDMNRSSRVTVPNDGLMHRYTARAWVKFAPATPPAPDPPQLVEITIEEWNDGKVIGSASDYVSMSETVYRPVQVTYTAQHAGDQMTFSLSRGRPPLSDGTVVQQDDGFMVGAATLVDAPARNPFALWPANLIVNPSFEGSTSGWTGYNASLATVAASDAPDGSDVARVTWAGAGTHGNYSINSENSDGPATAAVPFTESGADYTVRGYVKAGLATVGEPVQLSIRERSRGHVVNTAMSAPVILSAHYQPIEVTYKDASVGDQLDTSITRTSGPLRPGEYFYADAISLSQQAVVWAGDADQAPRSGWRGEQWTQSSAPGSACDVAPPAFGTAGVGRARFHDHATHAYHFRVRNGDTCDGSRSELANPVVGYGSPPIPDIPWDRQFYPGEDRWIAFQTYFPDDYSLRYPSGYNGATSWGQSVLQFHQRKGSDDTPPILVMDRGPTLCLFTVEAPSDPRCGGFGGVPMGNPPHRQWIDITLHIFFATDHSGYVRAYGDLHDGRHYRLLAELANQPTLKVNPGGWTPSLLRIGIYRDSNPITWGTEDLFVDGLTVGQDCSAVKINAYGRRTLGQVDC